METVCKTETLQDGLSDEQKWNIINSVDTNNISQVEKIILDDKCKEVKMQQNKNKKNCYCCSICCNSTNENKKETNNSIFLYLCLDDCSNENQTINLSCSSLSGCFMLCCDFMENCCNFMENICTDDD